MRLAVSRGALSGTQRAQMLCMAVRRDEDFYAWQLADAFKREVFRLVAESPKAQRNFKYRDQLQESSAGVTKHITEGFLRHSPLDFARFLDYAAGSLGEAKRRLMDGIELGYFPAPDCEQALEYATRGLPAVVRLKHSQIRYAARLRQQERDRRAAAKSKGKRKLPLSRHPPDPSPPDDDM
jgi:four helix bundle protein